MCKCVHRYTLIIDTRKHALSEPITHCRLTRMIVLILYVCTFLFPLQHTATYCNTLHHTATHYKTLQHTATHCNTLHYTATHCNPLQHTSAHSNTLQHTATLLLHWLFVSCTCTYFFTWSLPSTPPLLTHTFRKWRSAQVRVAVAVLSGFGKVGISLAHIHKKRHFTHVK